jgi:hypothetical protein
LIRTPGYKPSAIFFSTYEDRIPLNFPVEFFLTKLEIIMTNNIFTFGDTYWVQLQGTAMGTPAAPLYSILTFGYYKNTKILPYFTIISFTTGDILMTSSGYG